MDGHSCESTFVCSRESASCRWPATLAAQPRSMGQPSGGGQIPAGSLRQHDDVLRRTSRTCFLLFFVTMEPADKRVALLVLRRPALLVD